MADSAEKLPAAELRRLTIKMNVRNEVCRGVAALLDEAFLVNDGEAFERLKTKDAESILVADRLSSKLDGDL